MGRTLHEAVAAGSPPAPMLETQHSYEIARKCEQWRRTVGHGAFDASECPCERAVTHGEQVRGPQHAFLAQIPSASPRLFFYTPAPKPKRSRDPRPTRAFFSRFLALTQSSSLPRLLTPPQPYPAPHSNTADQIRGCDSAGGRSRLVPVLGISLLVGLAAFALVAFACRCYMIPLERRERLRREASRVAREKILEELDARRYERSVSKGFRVVNPDETVTVVVRCDDREEWEKAAERRRWEAEEREAEEVLTGAEDSPLDVRLTSSGTPLVGIGHLVIRVPSFKLKINPGGCLTPAGGGAESDDESGDGVEGEAVFRSGASGSSAASSSGSRRASESEEDDPRDASEAREANVG
jgi:hypothetical protein